MTEPSEQVNALTERIIGCAFTIANGLGAGFLEKVYENALRIELCSAGLQVAQQSPIAVCSPLRAHRSAPVLVGLGTPASFTTMCLGSEIASGHFVEKPKVASYVSTKPYSSSFSSRRTCYTHRIVALVPFQRQRRQTEQN